MYKVTLTTITVFYFVHDLNCGSVLLSPKNTNKLSYWTGTTLNASYSKLSLICSYFRLRLSLVYPLI